VSLESQEKKRREKEEFEGSNLSISMDVDSVESSEPSIAPGSVPIMKELASPPIVDPEDANSSSSIAANTTTATAAPKEPKELKEQQPQKPPVVKTPKVFDKQPLHKLLDYLLRVSEEEFK
jgi:hypothetical protein